MAIETVLTAATRIYNPGVSAKEAFTQADFGPAAEFLTFGLFEPLAFGRVWEEVAGNLD